MPGAAAGGCRGQSTVEVALTLPVVLLAALVVLQVLVVARDQVAVVHAAREATRVAALGGAPTSVRAAVHRVVPGAQVRIDRASEDPGTGRATVAVVVRHRPVRVPVLAGLLPAVTVSARQVMAVER